MFASLAWIMSTHEPVSQNDLPEMVERGRQHVAKLRLLPANIHFEKFVPATEAIAV